MLVAVLIIGVAVGVITTLLVVRARSADTPASRVEPAAPVPAPAPEPDTDLERLLSLAIDQLERSVVVIDADGEIRFSNTAATVLSGTHVGVLVDSAVDEIAAEARRNGPVERRVDLHGPPRSSLLLVARPVADGVVVIIEDVSERERIAKMRTDFVANISHELKTPVGAIAVLADALLDEEDPAVVARVAARIVDESGRAVTTIDDLLELSRIESAPLAGDLIDIHEIVEAALARGRTVESDKAVQLSAFEAREPIWIRGDSRQLMSAVGNLVENAVKYSEPEGVVQIRTRRDDRWIEIMVADQGVGIPARDRDRIFERFYRVDRARSRTTGGTGLGLAIVRHVATNHGGDVQVSSTEGEGSTFVLRLPSSLATAPPGDGRFEADGGESGTDQIGSDEAMSEGT